MSKSTQTTDHGHSEHGHHGFEWKALFWPSTNHFIIGLQYLFTGIFMAIIGVFMAYVFRMQLAWPGTEVPLFGIVGPGDYNTMVTIHGTIMIFWVAMPVLIAAFGNFLIPLMLGADDMVFPRLNCMSYWVFLLSAIILIASLFVPGGGFGGGWTAYPPHSADETYSLTKWGQTLWVIAVALEFVAFLMGGINFVTTTMNARAKGMKMYDIPIVVWFIVIASILFMISVGPLIAGAAMLVLDQFGLTSCYNVAGGGDPLLWQHLFWFFGHPEVYVVLLPALGVCAEIIPTFARKKLFAYKIVLYTAFATGILSFVVWAHHQFIAGIDPRMANIFTVTTLLISIPITEMVFVYIATLYGGSIDFKTPMLWALAFIAEFLLGGCTGIYLGCTGVDIYFHDTYFVVAHFHFVFVPIAVLAVYAGFTYWFPKATGKMLCEKLGKIHFWGTIIPFTVIFLLLFVLGMAGQHRRIADFTQFPELVPYQETRVIVTCCLLVMIAFQAVFVWNVIKSLFWGEKADKNPWRANTLEWLVPNVPPHGNFLDGYPEVYRGPYEYSVEGRKDDYWPQNEPPESAERSGSKK